MILRFLVLLLLAQLARAYTYEQPLVALSGNWAFGTSESSRNFKRCERISVPGVITHVSIPVLKLQYNEGIWSTCNEPVAGIRLRVFADSLDRPGEELFSGMVSYQSYATGEYFADGIEVCRLELAFPLAMVSTAWVSCVGEGLPDCFLLWGKGEGGDAFSLLDRGFGWETVPYDLAMEVRFSSLDRPELHAAMLGTEQLHLSWSPVEAGMLYRLECSWDLQNWLLVEELEGNEKLFTPAEAPGSFFRVSKLLP